LNLLGAKLYDPAVAVNKVTTAAIAMTALDTTNLRLAITVPAHGMVRFRLMACLHGATTFPSILLGVMNGANVIGRVAPIQSLGNTAVATALVNVEADFVATGLTPGAMNVDAAYAVETLVAATGLKYGGPNNTTANDAFGAFVFEAWDPQPMSANSTLSVDASGRVDVGKVLGTAQTAGDLKASMNTLQADTDDIQTRLPAALVSGRMDSSTGAMAANVVTAAAINASALNGKGDWNIGKTGYALSSAGVQAIWDALTSALTTVGSVGKRIVDFLDAAVSTRSTYAGGAVASVTGSVGSIAAGGIPASAFGAGAIDAAALATDAGTEIASAILGASVDGTTTVVQSLRLVNAAVGGKSSGHESGAPVYRDLSDTKNVIAATLDADNNRLTVTRNLT
jgi:hypothetical protein